MSDWDQRIRDHRVFAEMRSLGPVIDSAASVEGIEAQAFAGLERIRAILAFCGKRLAAADPLITLPAPLEEVAAGLAGARQEVERFVSDKDPAHITAANIQADRALSGVIQVPTAYSPEELGALVAMATTYRTTIEQNLADSKRSTEEFGTETQRLRSNLGELAATLQVEQQKLGQVVTDYQRQFSEAQEKRSQEFSDALRQGQQDLTKIISDYQGQFSTAQENRGREFAEAQGTRQEKFGQIVNEYSQRLTEQNAEFTRQREELTRKSEEQLAGLNMQYSEKATAILAGIEEEKMRVEKLVGVIGNLGVTAGYLRNANQARWSMWFWQAVTVGALVVLSWTAFHTLSLLEDSRGQFNWGGFAGRVVLLGSLGVIAAYAGKQADKLFEVEKRNRKLALELEAIGPYLAPLPQEEQNKFRIQMGDRSFGREDDIGVHPHSKSPATLIDLLKSKESKEAIDLILEIAKKAK